MRAPWKPIVIGFAAGLIGVALGALIWTAIVDHQHITAVWELELRRAAAATPAK